MLDQLAPEAPILYSLSYRDGVPIDEVAVRRACDGDGTVTLTAAELAEAYDRLIAGGYPVKHAALILGITVRKADRWAAAGGPPTMRADTTPRRGRPAGATTEPARLERGRLAHTAGYA